MVFVVLIQGEYVLFVRLGPWTGLVPQQDLDGLGTVRDDGEVEGGASDEVTGVYVLGVLE